MLGLGFALTNFGTKGGVVDTPDLSGSSAAALLAAYGGEGFSMIFDSTAPSLKITDSTTPSNDWDSDLGDGYSVQDFFKSRSFTSYSGPVSTGKRLMQSDGYIKPCRHNLLPMSNRFGSGAWTRTAVTSTYGQTDADGGSTASLITESNTSTSVLYTTTAFTTAANVPYTISVKIKKGNSTWVRLAFGTSGGTFTNGVQQWYDLDTVATGTAATTGTASHIASTITADTNSYYILTLTASQASTTGAFIVSTATADASATRTTSGTYYICHAMCNSGSSVLDYVSSEAHNLILQSQTLDNASWLTTGSSTSVTANATASPDGTTTADLVYQASGSIADRYQNVTVPASSTVSSSFYFKASGKNYAYIQINGSTGGTLTASFVTFDLSAGTVGTITALANGGLPNAVAGITDVGNGWYRCYFSAGVGTSNTAASVYMGGCNAANSRSGTASVTDGIYVFGAQVELASSPGKYVATTAAAVYNPHFDLPVEFNTDGTVKALTREEARTNLTLYNTQFANAAWTELNIATITEGSTVAPNGVAEADTLTASSGSAAHMVYQAITTTAATNYAISCYVKNGTNRYITMSFQYSGATGHYATAVYDLDGGGSTATQTSVGATSGTIASTNQESVGNGWYRLTLVAQNAQTANIATIGFAPAATGNTFNTFGHIVWNAAGTETFHVWGHQLEAGSTSSSVIVTGSAAVTRAADFITCASTIFPYASGPGTIYAKWNLPALVTTAVQSAVSLGIDANDYVFLGANNTIGSNYGLIQSGGVGQATITSATTSANAEFKQALAYATNDAAYVVNNGTPGTDASVTLPASATTLIFGANTSNANGLQGYFKEFAYFPSRLTNTQLGTITTA